MFGFNRHYEKAMASRLPAASLPAGCDGELPYYRPVLEVTETDVYTHPSAWAHTVPAHRTISIRPREHLPYASRDVILNHEIEHNIDPSERNEDLITARGMNSGRRYLRSYFDLHYRKAA